MINQSSNHLFMIEPEVFYSNEQTADSNHYQKDHDTEFTKDDVLKKALLFSQVVYFQLSC
jgi:hypothetical protein